MRLTRYAQVMPTPLSAKLCPMCGGSGGRKDPQTGKPITCAQCGGSGRVPG